MGRIIMTQEEKELLLKDLCARLPYGVKILDIPANVVGKLFLISTTDTVQYETADDTGIQSLYGIKPYLFPLSSMTYEQKGEYNFLRDLVPTEQQYEIGNLMDNFEFVDNWKSIDYLNANHFDYRGLIEHGLAIDATGSNIY